MSNTLGPHDRAAFEAWFCERYSYSRAVLTNQFWASEVKEASDAFAAGQAAERERWKVAAIAACNSAGDGPDNGCCPTYWEDAREACIAAILTAP
jgi:hypothetical protein